MRFTPYNIKNQEFNKALRGYDKDEVHAFLESLSNEFERLLNENEDMKSQVKDYKLEIREYKKLEKTLQNTLVNAQQSSSRAVESAKKQNALIIKEAEIKSAQLIEKAKEEADKLRNSVFELRDEKKLLLAKLKAMVDTQIKVLDMSSKIIESVPEESKEETKIETSSLDIDDIVEKLL